MNMGNGGTVSNTFDLNGRLTAANPGATMERNFTYDANGHLLTVTAANTPWVNRTFAYDALNRLTSATGPFGTFSYLYDDTGNRLSAVLGSRNETYSYFAGTNRLSEIDGTEETLYAYDTEGNTTSMGSLSLAWNREGRLIRVESGATPVSQYLYNAFGQRVLKSAGGLTTLYLYDFDGNLISETDGSGAIVTEYLYRGRVRLAMADRATGAVYTFHNSELGTPELMTDSTNTVVWEGISKPFGETAVNSGSTVVNNFRFQGQYYDAETGLHYNGQRYYDPKTGRYLTPDPIGLAGGVNPYVYVGNDPINYIDPLGLYIGQFPPPPPGYDPTTWKVSQWDNGRWLVESPEGRIYTAHPEDTGHWRHWNIQGPSGKDGGSWPPNPGKPWPNQKKLKDNQCETDPSGNAPDWSPPFIPFMPLNPLGNPLRLPTGIPLRIPVPVW